MLTIKGCMVGPSHAPYRWATHKITLAYIVVQFVSNFGKDDIIREDNIHNGVQLLNEKSQFTRGSITDNHVKAFLRVKKKLLSDMRTCCPSICDLFFS
jgi:hypothetical protein